METWNIDLNLTKQTAQFIEEVAKEENLTVNKLITSILEGIAYFNRPSIKSIKLEKEKKWNF